MIIERLSFINCRSGKNTHMRIIIFLSLIVWAFFISYAEHTAQGPLATKKTITFMNMMYINCKYLQMCHILYIILLTQ